MRSHYCGQVTEQQLDQEVTICGWVNKRRDHGGVIFIDLRDREGLVQVVFDPDRAEIFAIAEQVRSEYVLKVKGRVRARDEGAINTNLATGKNRDFRAGTRGSECVGNAAFSVGRYRCA